MPGHEYTAEQALQTLMEKLRTQDDALAAQIQTTIDAGKDVFQSENAAGGRKKNRVYRKAVPLTTREALKIALDALQAYFVEQPLFVASAADNLAKAAVGVPRQVLANWAYSPAEYAEEPEPLIFEGANQEKAVEIEMQTETQLSKTGEETIRLKRVPQRQISDQHQNIKTLRKLFDFAPE